MTKMKNMTAAFKKTVSSGGFIYRGDPTGKGTPADLWWVPAIPAQIEFAEGEKMTILTPAEIDAAIIQKQ